MPSESTTELVTPDAGPVHRFRGATLEEAVAQARRQLGDDVTPRSAARLRQGGLLGFFAKDLGVEVTVERGEPGDEGATSAPAVAAAPETVDSVFERLVGEATAIERTPSPAPPPAREPVFAQLLARALERVPGEPSRATSGVAAHAVAARDVALPTPSDGGARALAAASASIAEQIGAVVRHTLAREAGAESVIVVPVVIVVDSDGRIRDGAPALV